MADDDFAAFVDARAVPRPRRPGRRLARAAATSRPRLVERLARARRSASRPTAPTCASTSRAAPGSTPTAGATCPAARSSPGRSRTRANGHDPLHGALEPARRRRRRRRADVRATARVVGAARRARRGLPARDARRPTPAPAAWASSASAPTSGSTAPTGSILLDEKIGGTVHLALGRSYPETGGINDSARALGHDLRPARRRTADRSTARPIAPHLGLTPTASRPLP